MEASASFDPRRIVASTPVDPRCTYVRDSIADAGWTSVLYRVGRRNDSRGAADMGATEHPRLTLTHRGSFDIRRRDGGVCRSGRLAPGRSWLVPPGEPLRYDWSGAGTGTRELAILVLPRHQLIEAADAIEDRQPSLPVRWEGVRLADDDVIGAVMTGIRQALTAGADDLYAESASAFLLQHLLVTYGSAGAAAISVGREDARVRAVVDHLHDNLHRPITLREMAGAAALSQYHFLRVFRAATGETPRRYLTRLRIDAARRRLAQREVSITEVSASCGFATPSSFAAAFRAATGVSPREYRRQVGG